MDGPFSENLGENIFHLDDDEVVLCLNYDGKFGLNNINQYFNICLHLIRFITYNR